MISKREAAIISTYTNILLGNFSDTHSYIEEILGRSVFTHELAIDSVIDEIKEKSREDFMNLEIEE